MAVFINDFFDVPLFCDSLAACAGDNGALVDGACSGPQCGRDLANPWVVVLSSGYSTGDTYEVLREKTSKAELGTGKDLVLGSSPSRWAGESALSAVLAFSYGNGICSSRDGCV